MLSGDEYNVVEFLLTTEQLPTTEETKIAELVPDVEFLIEDPAAEFKAYLTKERKEALEKEGLAPGPPRANLRRDPGGSQEMRIISLEVENFKPFSKVRIPPGDGSLPEGLFLILGPNSMGKTSLVQSILWALMGEDVIKVSSRRRLVRRRQPGCKVDLTFEIGGETYRVVRRLTLKKTKKKSTEDFDCEADLSQLVGTKFLHIKSGASNVNNEVEKLLSITPENMSNTVFIRQKEVDTLATAEPAYLREVITKLFGLDEFETVKERLSDRSTDLQGQLDDLRPKVGRLDAEREELGKRMSEKVTKSGQLKDISDEIGRDKSELDSLPNEQLLDDLETNQTKIHSKEEEIRNMQVQIDAVEPSLLQNRERIAAANEAIKKLELGQKNVVAELTKIPPSRGDRRTCEEARQQSKQPKSNWARC